MCRAVTTTAPLAVPTSPALAMPGRRVTTIASGLSGQCLVPCLHAFLGVLFPGIAGAAEIIFLFTRETNRFAQPLILAVAIAVNFCR